MIKEMNPVLQNSPSITDRFLAVCKDNPEKILFNYYDNGWRTVNFRDFFTAASSAASHLKKSGLCPGDRAAIISENRYEWCAAYLSILMAGGIAVPVDPQLGVAELKNLLTDSGARVVFSSLKTRPNVLACSGMLSGGPGIPVLLDFDSAEFKSLSVPEPTAEFSAREGGDVASIIYTSGTTGRPKGVQLSHDNFCSDADAMISAGIVSGHDNVLSVLPLHHTYAFMCTFLVPLLVGASITYPLSLKGPDIAASVREKGVTLVVAVPQLLMLIRNNIIEKIKALPGAYSFVLLRILKMSGLLREKTDINIGRLIFRKAHEAFGDKLRFFASGGARLDPSIMKDLEGLGFSVLEGYGLTETSPVVAFNPPSRRKPGSAGVALPGVEIRIMDPSETGEGEIIIKGPMVMKGYYRNPEATGEVLKEGWLRTGDIGRLDNERYLFITGRSKEIIVLSSGKNIYPEEVEKMYLEGSPIIKEVCVVESAEKGMAGALHAVIVPDTEYAKKRQIVNIHEEIKWEINRKSAGMPSYMRVNGFTIRSEPLPRTPLGKLRRFMIKASPAKDHEGKKQQTGIEQFGHDETSEKVRSVVGGFAGPDINIGDDDNLELDLGLDSLSKLELVVSLEKAFSIRLAEDFMSDVHKVRDLTEKIRAIETSEVGGTARFEKAGLAQVLTKEPDTAALGTISIKRPGPGMVFVFLLHKLLGIWFRVFFRLEAKGIENIPLGRNYIIAANHTSYLDGFAVILALPFAYFRTIYSLGLSEFFTGFIRSRLAKMAHVIPIDSSSYLSKALQMSAYVLRNNLSLSVFPEGGRSFNGSLMEFKKGVGVLAVEMGVPVVPVLIQGAYYALPRDAKLPRPRKITVTFGRPLLASDIDFSRRKNGTDDYQYFADLLKERVEELGQKQ